MNKLLLKNRESSQQQENCLGTTKR